MVSHSRRNIRLTTNIELWASNFLRLNAHRLGETPICIRPGSNWTVICCVFFKPEMYLSTQSSKAKLSRGSQNRDLLNETKQSEDLGLVATLQQHCWLREHTLKHIISFANPLEGFQSLGASCVQDSSSKSWIKFDHWRGEIHTYGVFLFTC